MADTEKKNNETENKGIDAPKTHSTFKWKVADVSRITFRYMIVDTKAIDKIVKEKGKEAEKLVGGITVTEIKSTYIKG